jgi:hypothetical protein
VREVYREHGDEHVDAEQHGRLGREEADDERDAAEELHEAHHPCHQRRERDPDLTQHAHEALVPSSGELRGAVHYEANADEDAKRQRPRCLQLAFHD